MNPALSHSFNKRACSFAAPPPSPRLWLARRESTGPPSQRLECEARTLGHSAHGFEGHTLLLSNTDGQQAQSECAATTMESAATAVRGGRVARSRGCEHAQQSCLRMSVRAGAARRATCLLMSEALRACTPLHPGTPGRADQRVEVRPTVAPGGKVSHLHGERTHAWPMALIVRWRCVARACPCVRAGLRVLPTLPTAVPFGPAHSCVLAWLVHALARDYADTTPTMIVPASKGRPRWRGGMSWTARRYGCASNVGVRPTSITERAWVSPSAASLATTTAPPPPPSAQWHATGKGHSHVGARALARRVHPSAQARRARAPAPCPMAHPNQVNPDADPNTTDTPTPTPARAGPVRPLPGLLRLDAAAGHMPDVPRGLRVRLQRHPGVRLVQRGDAGDGRGGRAQAGRQRCGRSQPEGGHRAARSRARALPDGRLRSNAARLQRAFMPTGPRDAPLARARTHACMHSRL